MNLNKTQSMTIKYKEVDLLVFSCLFVSKRFAYRSCLLHKATRNSFSTVSNRFRYLFFTILGCSRHWWIV